jgi:hypothetical protein
MTVRSLDHFIEQKLATGEPFTQSDVEELKGRAEDWYLVSDAEAQRLLLLLDQHPDLFQPDAAADLRRFARGHLANKSSWVERALEVPLAAVNFLGGPVIEAVGGVVNLFSTGTASIEDVAKIRSAQNRANVRGTAGIVKVAPDASLPAIEAAIQRSVAAIDGFAFLASPPAGATANEHTVLVKPGVNWGHFGYPTVTSWESVYATVKMTFAAAEASGAAVKVIVGDESGAEIKLWGGSTMANFEQTRILHAGVLAGLERAAAREASEPHTFAGAGALLAVARGRERIMRADREMIAMAEKAGVRVIGFDEVEHTRIPVPGARHFKDGILVPKIVAEEVTDIINLPKPPGRHVLMGNTGLTGAVKNHIGLLGALDRIPALHGPYDRYPAMERGENGDSFVDRLSTYQNRIKAGGIGEVAKELLDKSQLDWRGGAPGITFHEKVVELYRAFADKERFTLTDMRRTVSSLGPDLGDTLDIGAVIAAKDPVSVDVLASAFLKRAYEGIGDFGDAAKPGGDTVVEWAMGKAWLRQAGATAFDLLATLAANAYGVGPADREHLDMRNLDGSGFSAEELRGLDKHLARAANTGSAGVLQHR